LRPNFPSIVLVVTLRAPAQANFDEFTPCSVAVSGFTSHEEGKIQQASQFIVQVLEQLNREHGQLGEPAILNNGLKTALVAATRGACAQYERSTISIEASKVYRSMRVLIFGHE
jgi:hypothetical protein